MANSSRTKQFFEILTNSNNGEVVPIFTADADDSTSTLNAFYRGQLSSLVIELYLPELDETESDLRRDRGLVETSGFVPGVDSSKGRYLALVLRRKGETEWSILREFLLLRRAGVEREAINLLAPGLGGNLFGLESDVELGLMVFGNKGAGGLGGSEYIRAMGSVEEVYSTVSGSGGNPVVFDWELGDYIWTAKFLTGAQERWGKLWVPLTHQASSIGKPGSPTSSVSFADERLFDLYSLYWSSENIALNQPKGASAQADWDALKVLLLPNTGNRAIAVATTESKFCKLEGSATKALSVAEMPAHNHAAMQFNPSGWSTGTSSQGYGQRASDFNNLDGQTGSAGQGQAFSLLQPTAYIARTLLVCAG